MTFTPTDTTDYTRVTDHRDDQRPQATPTITWANPADITYGTPLGTQLDATASVQARSSTRRRRDGPEGRAGPVLSVTFTPTDTTDYTSATATVTINVLDKATPTITWANPADITYGTALAPRSSTPPRPSAATPSQEPSPTPRPWAPS